MKLKEEHLQLIRDHYPREGCEEPWKVARIARDIGCTACAVEYQAAKMGIGKYDYRKIIERGTAYRNAHREERRRRENERYRFLYRNNDEYRRKRLKNSNNYYHNVVKQKRQSNDKKANL
ncbi:MAG: hypothetical protein MJZ26_08980 [Fibrobacter sp.]|nr:hypothetical protein [Fibrobacter sp.]